jgi:hypothetical protein
MHHTKPSVPVMIKTHKFCGIIHDIELETRLGSCDQPQGGKPTLYAPQDTGRPFLELDVLVHESLHACNWNASETRVDTTATDIARMLWRAGYRRMK